MRIIDWLLLIVLASVSAYTIVMWEGHADKIYRLTQAVNRNGYNFEQLRKAMNHNSRELVAAFPNLSFSSTLVYEKEGEDESGVSGSFR